MTTSFGLIQWVSNTKVIDSIINERLKASSEAERAGSQRSGRRSLVGADVSLNGNVDGLLRGMSL